MRKPACKPAAEKPAKSRRQRVPAKRSESAPQAYKMTQRERAITDAYWKRYDQSPPGMRFNVNQHTDHVDIHIDHPDLQVGSLLLLQALGTTNEVFANSLISQLRSALCKGQAVKAADLNHAVAMVQGIGPRDETEGMLAAQMAAIHNATMAAARRLNHVETLQQQDSASNMFNKLARTFTNQVEALKKYRSTGEQNIRVQHVNVNEGGQAIVGNVQTGGGGELKNNGQSHEPSHALAQSSALPCDVEANKEAVPRAGSQRQEGMSVPRRTRRRAKRPS